jgi:hypothetical protein
MVHPICWAVTVGTKRRVLRNGGKQPCVLPQTGVEEEENKPGDGQGDEKVVDAAEGGDAEPAEKASTGKVSTPELLQGGAQSSQGRLRWDAGGRPKGRAIASAC